LARREGRHFGRLRAALRNPAIAANDITTEEVETAGSFSEMRPHLMIAFGAHDDRERNVASAALRRRPGHGENTGRVASESAHRSVVARPNYRRATMAARRRCRRR